MQGRASESRHRVVVIGGGFGGLQAALKLARVPVEVTLIDRRNFHLFQPLAYQVATGALSPAEIAYPLRRVFRSDRNVRIVLAEVVRHRRRRAAGQAASGGGRARAGRWAYDTLIVSAGAEYNYFGHDQWREPATDLKTLEGALTLRRRLLAAFEAAELEPDTEQRSAWLTFVVVGAGPTGVEMAGQIAEIARDLRFRLPVVRPQRGADPARRSRRPGPQRLPSAALGKALRSLERLGVTKPPRPRRDRPRPSFGHPRRGQTMRPSGSLHGR